MMELRVKTSRIDSVNGEISGYINVTERESEVMFSKKSMKWFKEIMRKGVFTRALKKALEGSGDIPLLYNHNWSKKLASVKTGNLELKEDNIGLRFSAKIDDEETLELIKNGEVNGCSFGFVSLDEEVEPINPKMDKRFVNDITLVEVSVVHDPAYIGSLVEARSLEEALAEVEEIKEEENSNTTLETNIQEVTDSDEEKDNDNALKEEVQNLTLTDTDDEKIEEESETIQHLESTEEINKKEEVVVVDEVEESEKQIVDETIDLAEEARKIKTQNAKLLLEILKKKII